MTYCKTLHYSVWDPDLFFVRDSLRRIWMGLSGWINSTWKAKQNINTVGQTLHGHIMLRRNKSWWLIYYYFISNSGYLTVVIINKKLFLLLNKICKKYKPLCSFLLRIHGLDYWMLNPSSCTFHLLYFASLYIH